MTPPAKPVPSIDILASEAASEAHDNAVEAWGDGMALQIGRLCRWGQANGMKIDCPPARPDS